MVLHISSNIIFNILELTILLFGDLKSPSCHIMCSSDQCVEYYLLIVDKGSPPGFFETPIYRSFSGGKT